MDGWISQGGNGKQMPDVDPGLLQRQAWGKKRRKRTQIMRKPPDGVHVRECQVHARPRNTRHGKRMGSALVRVGVVSHGRGQRKGGCVGKEGGNGVLCGWVSLTGTYCMRGGNLQVCCSARTNEYSAFAYCITGMENAVRLIWARLGSEIDRGDKNYT